MGGPVVHRLGTVLCLAVAVWCLASGCAARLRRRAARGRLAKLFPVRRARHGPVWRPRVRPVLVAWAGPAGALSAGWLLVGGVPGVLVGCGAAFGAWRVLARSRSRPAAGFDPREAERQLPFAADLLAACLAAGAGPVEAAEVVGESLGGPVGERLALAGAELRLGGEPGAAWGSLARIPGARGLAECLERSARTGAPAAELVSPGGGAEGGTLPAGGRPGAAGGGARHRAGGAVLPARFPRGRSGARGDRNGLRTAVRQLKRTTRITSEITSRT